MKKALLALVILGILLCSVPGGLSGQITVTSSDIHKPVGYTYTEEGTAPGTFTVDLGSTGGPHDWDFSSYTMSWQETNEVVDPASTPFAADFPASNFCYNISDEGFYQYMRVDSDLWTYHGFGFEEGDSSYDVVYDPTIQIPLPIAFGDTWDVAYSWTDTLFGIVTIFTGRNHSEVDAWGTMTVPAGTFDVLRVVTYDTTITTVGIPPFQFSDTTTTIEYDWISKDPTYVVEVISREGETDPNFTQAGEIIRVASRAGIGDGRGAGRIPRAFELEQNVPNPFNPRTEIRFSVSDGLAGPVDLAVYTLRGKKVRTLYSGAAAPGDYTVAWDGRDDRGTKAPSGVYLYRLVAGKTCLTRKMIMAK